MCSAGSFGEKEMSYKMFMLTVTVSVIMGNYISESVFVKEREFTTLFSGEKYVCKKIEDLNWEPVL